MGNILGRVTTSVPSSANPAAAGASTSHTDLTRVGEVVAGVPRAERQPMHSALSQAPARPTAAGLPKPARTQARHVGGPLPLPQSTSQIRSEEANVSQEHIWQEVRHVLEDARLPAKVIGHLKLVFDGLHEDTSFTCISDIASKLLAEHDRLSGQTPSLDGAIRREKGVPVGLMANALKKLTWLLTAQLAFQHLAPIGGATPPPRRTEDDATLDGADPLPKSGEDVEALHWLAPACEWGMNGPRGGTRTDSGQAEEHHDDTLTLRDQIIWSIFSARRNFGSLPQVPRQDMTLKDWLVNGPSWLYLPYIHYSPTEMAVVAKHFHLKPALAAIRQTFGDARGMENSALSPAALSKQFQSIPRAIHHAANAYLELLKEMKAANQEAREFRSDLSTDPWVKNGYRHAYWMCSFAQRWSAAFASDLGYAHEYAHLDMTIEGPYDSVIDKINNLWGIRTASPLGSDCAAEVNRLGDAGHLAWAKDYQIDEASGRHVPTAQNIQGPLDELWQRYQELPAFNRHDLEALRSLHVQMPNEAAFPQIKETD